MSENLLSYGSFYFLGIGGVSMSALAKILHSEGKAVAGFDRVRSTFTEELETLGIRVEYGNDGDVSDYAVVVYTDAIQENNRALIRARRLGKIIVSRGKLLYEVSKLYKKTVAVAGCHGKTTCAAMLAHIFGAAGLAFSAHIGGEDLTYTNGYVGGKDYFITEACEYKKNLLYLQPDIAVVLNSDSDHLDCYSGVDDIKNTYRTFANSATEAVNLFGDLDGVDAITFGFDDRAFYFAKRIRNECGRFSFVAYEGDDELGRVFLDVYGKHNVLNSLAALAVARRLGIGFEEIQAGLNGFKGVKRRFEEIGSFNGALCIADYAHHPNEIKATLKTARVITPGELYVVFQPHTYSRTKNLFKEFVLALSSVKKLLVYKTYAAREYYDDAGSALTLASHIKKARYGDCVTDVIEFISGAGRGDTVLFLGAGDIYDIASDIVKD